MTAPRPTLAALLPLLLAGLAPAALAAQDTGEGDVGTETEAEAPPPSKGDVRLAKLLEGRVAGEPLECIQSLPNQRMTTIDRTAYVYGSGNTIYVQRTRNPDSIRDRDTLVVNRFGGTRLCRLDQATTVDPVTGIFTGVVLFDDFVPYTRVKDGGTDNAG